MTPFPQWLARQAVRSVAAAARRTAARVAARRQPKPTPAVLESVMLPNGRFLLLLSNLGDDVETEELIQMNQMMETLGDRIGAASVLIMPGPVVALNADQVVSES